MGKLLEVLESGYRALFGYESSYRTIEETIDEEVKEKTGKEIWAWSTTGRVYGAMRLIELANKSLVVNINHRNLDEVEVMNDSYIYSAMYDAIKRGVNIDIITTRKAYHGLSQDILGITEVLIADTDNFPSYMEVDEKRRKNVSSENGKTFFWFFPDHR